MTIDTLTQFLPDFLDGKSAWALLGLRLIWGTALIVNGLPTRFLMSESKQRFNCRDRPSNRRNSQGALMQRSRIALDIG
jgi:anti-sigma factor RsiW